MIGEKVLRKGEVLYEEPEFLLRGELREPRIYKLILKGLALGYETLGELVNFTGLSRGHISRYLDTLERLDLVGYELPYGKRKRGRYYIKDNLFNFWFCFVYPNLGDLELGLVDEVWTKIERELNAYYGKAFERLVVEMFRQKIIDFGQRRVARWWHKGEEIDAIAELEDGLLFVEMKWSELKRRNAEKIIEELEKKAEWFEGNKSFLFIAKKIEDKAEGSLTGFQNNQNKISSNPPVPSCCNPDCQNFPALNINRSPEKPLLPIDFYHCLVNCDEVSLFFECEEFWLVNCPCEFLDCFPGCYVADF